MSFSYVKNNLTPNETIRFQTTIHPIATLGPTLHLIVGAIGAYYAPPVTARSFALGDLAIAFASNPFQVIGVLTLVWMALGVAQLVKVVIQIMSTEIAVTSHRLILKTGLFWRYPYEISRGSKDSLELAQSPLGRYLNYGSLKIYGRSNNHIFLKYISRPMSVREAMARHDEGYA